ncbi:MAG TPA: TauD/TfdA family dioxygenase [Chthonomonadaceae bacterium]|nr:TauD/TfdA family dioxygenase [Chthonomonadaceae bacterium]
MNFPAITNNEAGLRTADEVAGWVAGRRTELTERLADAGALIFRGFPLRTAEEFDAFVSAFGWPNFPYDESLSNAVRLNRTARVFTANEAPPETTIFLHHEMAQTPVYPAKLFFFCEQPAETGGATPLCRSDWLWDRLQTRCPDFARACEEKGLRYSHTMPAASDLASGMGRSWADTLGVAGRDEAERRLTELGYSWEWRPDGSLTVRTPTLPAVRPLGGGRKAFFNQLIAAYCGWKDARNDASRSITFGDAEAMDRDGVMAAVAIADELTVPLEWQRGDVALVDNFAVLHGRQPFTGVRKVLASLVERTDNRVE